MEEEAQKLRQFTEEAETQNALREESAPGATPSTPVAGVDVNEDEIMDEDPAIVDARSVYVGNVGFWRQHKHMAKPLNVLPLQR